MTIKTLMRCLLLVVFCASVPLAFSATAEEYYRTGLASYQQGDYKTAVKYFDTALKNAPNHWQSYQARGHAYYKMGKKQEALDSYRESLRIHPEDPPLRKFANSLEAELGEDGVPAIPTKTKRSKTKSTDLEQDVFINPAGFIFGTAGVGYERVMGEDKSLTGQISFASHSFTGQTITMFGVGGSYRFWKPGPQKLEGLFVGPALSILSIKWSFDFPSFDPATYRTVTTNESMSALFFSVGAEGGYQWIFDNQVLLAVGLNLGFMIGGFEEKAGWPEYKYSGFFPGLLLTVGYAF